MRAIACIGNYAKVPYYFEKLDIRVFCLEELCYCLKENAFLLGSEVMHDTLLKFISNECDVPELARELYPLVHKKGSVSTFVSMILEYVGFYSPEEIAQIEKILKQNAHLPEYEKRKVQIDYLVEKKRYSLALEEYTELYQQMPQGTAAGGVLHNIGVVYARMMMYDKAAEAFRKAYELNHDSLSMVAFLGAKRFVLTDQEYVDFVAGLSEYYAEEMELERLLEASNEQWEDSAGYLGIVNMQEWRQEGRFHKYDDECGMILENLKKEYRSSMQV